MSRGQRIKSGTWFLLLFLPFIDVLAEIGVAASFPQLRALYGSSFRASAVISVSPFLAVLSGWIWGRLVERFKMRTVLCAAMLGWSAGVILFGLFLHDFGFAVVMRGVQGMFASGFASLPFIGFTRVTEDHQQRTIYYGHLETAISVGAISAPVLVGTAFSSFPGFTMAVIGSTVFLLTLFSGNIDPRSNSIGNAHETGVPEQKRDLKVRVLVPTLYAAATADGRPDRRFCGCAAHSGGHYSHDYLGLTDRSADYNGQRIRSVHRPWLRGERHGAVLHPQRQRKFPRSAFHELRFSADSSFARGGLSDGFYFCSGT